MDKAKNHQISIISIWRGGVDGRHSIHVSLRSFRLSKWCSSASCRLMKSSGPFGGFVTLHLRHSFWCFSPFMCRYHCKCVLILRRQDIKSHSMVRFVSWINFPSWRYVSCRQAFWRVRGAPFWEMILTTSSSISAMLRTGAPIWAGVAFCRCEVLLSRSSSTSSMLRMDTALVGKHTS